MFWKLIKDENNNYGYFGIGFMATGKKPDRNYPNTFFLRSDNLFAENCRSHHYKFNFPAFIVATSALIATTTDLPMILKQMFVFCIFFGAMFILYKIEYYINAIFCITCIFYFLAVDIIFALTFTFLFSSEFLETFYSSMINQLILSLIIKILDVFVFYFLYQKFREIYFDIRKKEWFLLNVIMTLFWFLAVVFMEEYPLLRPELLELGVYLYAFLVVYIVSIIVIYFFAEMSTYFLHARKSLVMESNYCVLEEQIAMQNEVGVKLRKIRHDIKNLVGDALLLIDKGEVLLAKDILISLNDEVSDISVTLEGSSGNSVIDSIVGYKVAICRQKEIPFTYILEDLPELDIRPDGMASILSNLLDNAIEASQEAKNPYIKVKIFRYKDFAVLNVENSYKNSPVIRNGKLVTSKSDSDNHGLGMSIVLDMVRQNRGDMNYTFSGDVFKVTILLPKSEGNLKST